jgi:hypothetical protein
MLGVLAIHIEHRVMGDQVLQYLVAGQKVVVVIGALVLGALVVLGCGTHRDHDLLNVVVVIGVVLLVVIDEA